MTTENLVRAILVDHFHLLVDKIPECEQRTPDFFAHNEKEKYLVEVKEKAGHPGLRAGQDRAFSNDELFHIAESIEPRAVLENIIRLGRQQIDAFACDEDSFRIVWVHCTGLAFDATRDQIVAGLYGAETVVDWGEGGFGGPCYYFNESQFFKYRNSIDGVAVSCVDETMRFCVNDHSPRYEALRRSVLAQGFGKGLVDPPQDERDGEAFLVDVEIDRRDRPAVMSYLEEKYQTKQLRVVPMQYHEVRVLLPK